MLLLNSLLVRLRPVKPKKGVQRLDVSAAWPRGSFVEN
jgi:hypothetical protein